MISFYLLREVFERIYLCLARTNCIKNFSFAANYYMGRHKNNKPALLQRMCAGYVV